MVPPLLREQIPTAAAVIPRRILVVDDEPLIRWSICSALAAAGFEVVSAADGAEARRMAAEWPPPRVVLLDRRAGEDAWADLVEEFRTRYADCRVVILTTAADRLPADGVCPDVVLQKPFDLEQLVRLVRHLAADLAPA